MSEDIRRVRPATCKRSKRLAVKTIQASRYGVQMDLHSIGCGVRNRAGCGSPAGVWFMQAHSWLWRCSPCSARRDVWCASRYPHCRSLPHEGRRKKSMAACVSVGSGRLVLAAPCRLVDILGATSRIIKARLRTRAFLVPVGDVRSKMTVRRRLERHGSCSLVGQDVFVPAQSDVIPPARYCGRLIPGRTPCRNPVPLVHSAGLA